MLKPLIEHYEEKKKTYAVVTLLFFAFQIGIKYNLLQVAYDAVTGFAATVVKMEEDIDSSKIDIKELNADLSAAIRRIETLEQAQMHNVERNRLIQNKLNKIGEK